MKRLSTLALIFGAALLAGAGARADEIRNPTAIFAGLDKITGRIISFDVAMDETVQFGTLQITPRVCLTRPQTEAPLTEGFVEVDEIEAAKTSRRVFSGWMFAASPGLHGVEHPVYDVWLKDCKGGVETLAAPPAGPDVNAPPPANAAPAPREPAPAKKPRRTITPENPVEPKVDPLPADVIPDRDPLAVAPEPSPAHNGVGIPGAVDNGFGPPVEVGPPPGAPKPKPKKPPKPKPKPAPDANFDSAPLDALPPDSPPPRARPRRQPLDPVSPNDLPRDPF
jgi:hypothetical protein